MAVRQDQFRAIISRRRRDTGASVARSLLRVVSLGYGLVVRVRNALYNHRILRIHHVDAVVLSVGNLTTGGTGKTPLVAWLCQTINQKSKIKNQKCRVAILTRGYKAATQNSELKTQDYNDEPALLAAMCPDVPVVVNPDRVAGAGQAISEGNAHVLVLDDGFQHRRLARDLDIVTIDATSPFGYERLLPAGLLREPVTALRRADAVVVTRCDQVSQDALARIESRIRQVNPRAIVSRSIHRPVGAATHAGSEIALESLQGKRVYAFCGIGNPDAFYDTLRRIGCILVGYQSFDDHHEYTRDCLSQVQRQAEEHGAEYAITTQKDWTKIADLPVSQSGPSVLYLAIELAFTAGPEQLRTLIDRVLDSRMPQRFVRQE